MVAKLPKFHPAENCSYDRELQKGKNGTSILDVKHIDVKQKRSEAGGTSLHFAIYVVNKKSQHFLCTVHVYSKFNVYCKFVRF